jgi:hypothetical protein
VRNQLLAAVKLAEEQLATTLGLVLEQDSSKGTLADQLTVAVAALGKGLTENCPNFAALKVSQLLAPLGDISPKDRIVELRTAFNTFVSGARVDIAKRYDWWLRETEPGSKAGLLFLAAKTFDEDDRACPVCERPIEDEALVATLRSLKSLDSALGKELQSFFADVSDKLKAITPATIRTLSDLTPEQRLSTDWQAIQNATLGQPFRAITDKFNDRLLAIAQASPIPATVPLDVLPSECDNTFSEAARSFVASLHNAARALEVVEWTIMNYEAIESQVTQLLFADGSAAASLLSDLNRGKSAAAAIAPFIAAARDLAKLSTEQQKCDNLRKDLAILEQLAAPLDVLKQLAKYAESEVTQIFDGIRDKTLANLRHMYPGTGSGMQPSRLQIGKGRDKTVEAYLLGEQYEVPAQHFANAGLQRAIALAFYFALLDPSLSSCHSRRWAMSRAVETCGALPRRLGDGFFGPRGCLR